MNDLIERIVIPLDAASESRNAIDVAAQLAARTKSPLHGIFVEDADLLGLAILPFARQVTFGAGGEPLTVEHIKQQLRVATESARRDIAAAAEHHGLTWSFEVVRGSPESALSHTSERDLVVAGALTRPVAGQFRVKGRWWSSIGAAPGPLLLARHAWQRQGAILVMLRDQSHGSGRLLNAAARIAEARNVKLTLICTTDPGGREGLEPWATGNLAQYSVPLQIEPAPTEGAALQERMLELDCRLLAIEASFAEQKPGWITAFVERAGCDLLVVR